VTAVPGIAALPRLEVPLRYRPSEHTDIGCVAATISVVSTRH
jgi:hypothetical protein